MKPVMQEIVDAGVGDCFSACLASLLEIPLTDVPKFRRDSPAPQDMMPAARKWLAETHGLSIVTIQLEDRNSNGGANFIGSDIRIVGAVPGTPCIGGGESPNFKDVNHAVVGEIDEHGMNFRMTHDPNPSGKGTAENRSIRTMKRWIVICSFIFMAAISAHAQCTSTPADPCVPVSQSTLDRMSKALTELAAAREAIADFKTERLMTDQERAAYKNVVSAWSDAFDAAKKGIADRDAVIALQQKTMELYAALVDKLTAQLNKPKSAWQKFITTLREIALLAGGIALGRGGL